MASIGAVAGEHFFGTMLFGAVAGQVGLQLLLTPSTSTLVFKSTSLILGTAYPIYSTLALLESSATAKEREQEAAQWLTYWAVYGVITTVEQMFETRPPLYYHIKLALLFWLQNSHYQGARRLYMLFLRPFIQQHRPQIDTCISFVRGMVASPGALYVGNQIHNMIAKVPYLQWFVQPFDGRDNRPRHLL